MGRSNCSRVFVYSAVMRRASSQMPMAVAHKRSRGPLDQPATGPRRQRRRAASPAAARRGRGAPGGQGRWSCPGPPGDTPSPARSTRNTPMSWPTPGGDDGRGSACWPTGTQQLGAVEPPAVAVGRPSVVGASGPVPDLGQGRGQHPAAGGHARQQRRTLLVGAELVDRQRGQHGGEVRDRGRRPPDLLEDQADLEEAEAAAADVLGQGDAEQAGVGQGRPQPGRVRIARGLDAPSGPRWSTGRRGSGRPGPTTACCSSLNEKSMAGAVPRYRSARGRPRPNMAIRSRCTSLVPPPKVRMMRLRYLRSRRELQERLGRSPAQVRRPARGPP